MPVTVIGSRQAVENNGIKLLVHGRAGMGKTRLCATAPTPLVLSAESGLLSLREYDLPTIVIRSMGDLYEAYGFITSSQEAAQYETICLDSISEMAEQLLAAEKQQSKDPRKAYGELQDKMSQLIRAFRDLPGKHVYFSSKMAAVKDEMSGVTVYGPSMPGQKLAQGIPYFFDQVCSLEIAKDAEGNDFRYLRTKANLQYEAKDRSGVLAEFEAPDLTHLINKILGRI